MEEKFKDNKFDEESLARIEQVTDIIENFQAQGLRLTLRQLYYQLVTVNAITNEEKSYKNLSKLLSKARLAGLVDWDAIEDRIRQPIVQSQWDDIQDLVSAAVKQFRMPRWRDQDEYVELWVEKDALAGVLSPIARKWHITLMVNRGYSSQSAMYESANRIKEACDGEFDSIKAATVLYLGDHDPSGNDMVRDIRERLEMFGVEDLDVKKIALNYDQIQLYKPPPNPVKFKPGGGKGNDPRAQEYIKEFGHDCWEVDALKPTVTTTLIETEIKKHVHLPTMEKVIKEEEVDKKLLLKAVEQLMADKEKKGKGKKK